MSGVIDRPEVAFDAGAHAYKLEGEDVLGVSTIAKVGGVEKAFDIASRWGFRVGYEGAFDLVEEHGRAGFVVEWKTRDGEDVARQIDSYEAMREALIGRGLAPWAKRDAAAERGSWVHDVLEELGQEGAVPDMSRFPEEVRGHATSVLRFFLHFRPKFVAMEVQIASRVHRFAGRYDVRCLIDARRLLACIDPLRDDPQAERVRELAAEGKDALVLLDLKTSKGIYPETHFPQLEGYELGGVEMGFPATDCRAVLNTWPDGDFDPARDLAVSWANGDDFVAFANALRAIRRIAACDPEAKREARLREVILAHLPAASRELAKLGETGEVPELAGLSSRSIGGILGKLRKKGLVEQGERYVWQLVERASE